jgi:N,N'-diacetyllegionaminate synthase
MYPIGPEDANLACMDMLRDTLSCDVGYSDHTEGTQALKAAISMGAQALEFHFTDDREGKDFRDQKCSKTLHEVTEVYEHILKQQELEGSAVKKPTDIEIATDHVSSFRRAAYYSRDLSKGTVVAEDDICFLRPAGKLHPYIAQQRLVGAKLTVDVKSKQEVNLQHIL